MQLSDDSGTPIMIRMRKLSSGRFTFPARIPNYLANPGECWRAFNALDGVTRVALAGAGDFSPATVLTAALKAKVAVP